MMKAPPLIIFNLLLAFSSVHGGNVCQTELWECKALSGSGQWKVAILNGDAVKKAIPVGLGVRRELKVDFSRDEKVRQVKINTDVDLEIVSITGPDIEEINIGGLNKSLKNLCIFTTPQLPSLKTLSIDNAEILNVEFDQLKKCNRNNAGGERLTIKITNSRMETDKTVPQFNTVTFYESPVVKQLELKDVSFTKRVEIRDFEKAKASGVHLIPYNACECQLADGDPDLRCNYGDECDSKVKKPFGPPEPEPPSSQGLVQNPSMISAVLPMIIIAMLFA